MIVDVKLEREDYDALHDIVYDICGLEFDDVKLQVIWDILPDRIQGTAIQWGLNDSAARDEIYEFIEKDYKDSKNEEK